MGHLRGLARQYTEDTVRTFAAIMRNQEERATGGAAAANSLLDRGWVRLTR